MEETLHEIVERVLKENMGQAFQSTKPAQFTREEIMKLIEKNEKENK